MIYCPINQVRIFPSRVRFFTSLRSGTRAFYALDVGGARAPLALRSRATRLPPSRRRARLSAPSQRRTVSRPAPRFPRGRCQRSACALCARRSGSVAGAPSPPPPRLLAVGVRLGGAPRRAVAVACPLWLPAVGVCELLLGSASPRRVLGALRGRYAATPSPSANGLRRTRHTTAPRSLVGLRSACGWRSQRFHPPAPQGEHGSEV